MDPSERSHLQIDEEDNESSVGEECPSASQTEGSGPPDHSEETTSPADPPQEALRDVYGDLTDKLHSPSLVEHLYAARILTVVEYETINSRGSNYDKNTEVLAAMRRRSQNEVLQFCQLLFTHNQHNCGRIMLAGLILVEHLYNIRSYYTSSITIGIIIADIEWTQFVCNCTMDAYTIDFNPINSMCMTLAVHIIYICA